MSKERSWMHDPATKADWTQDARVAIKRFLIRHSERPCATFIDAFRKCEPAHRCLGCGARECLKELGLMTTDEVREASRHA